jgi:hypothetical protein
VVRPAKTAIPAYLSQLAGVATNRGPQLRPLRPLFGPGIGEPTAADPLGPPGEFGEAMGRSNANPFDVQHHSPTEPLPKTGAGPVPGPRQAPLHSLPAPAVGDGKLLSAQPLSQILRPRPPHATPSPDPRLATTTAPTALPMSPAPVPSSPAPALPLSTQPPAPVEHIAMPRAADAPPAAPNGPPPRPSPQPDLRPQAPEHTDKRYESPSFTTLFEPPATTVPALVPIRREPDPPRPSSTTVPPAAPPQVSIGTIEVLVSPPTPAQVPVPNLPQPLRAMQPTLPGRAGTDVARRQARRWFGAGQS